MLKLHLDFKEWRIKWLSLEVKLILFKTLILIGWDHLQKGKIYPKGQTKNLCTLINSLINLTILINLIYFNFVWLGVQKVIEFYVFWLLRFNFGLNYSLILIQSMLDSFSLSFILLFTLNIIDLCIYLN